MNVTLYRTGDDPKKVTKTLTTVSTMVATATQPCDVLSPRLILGGDAIVNAINSNYCYIDTFARYYFIKKHITDTAARIIIECECDYLMSWAAGIKASRQLVTRSESVGSPTKIIDSKYPLASEKDMYVIRFEGGNMNLSSADVYSNNFVMNVAGGG